MLPGQSCHRFETIDKLSKLRPFRCDGDGFAWMDATNYRSDSLLKTGYQ